MRLSLVIIIFTLCLALDIFSDHYFDLKLGIGNDQSQISATRLAPIFRYPQNFDFKSNKVIFPTIGLGYNYAVFNSLRIGLGINALRRDYISNTNETIPISVNGKLVNAEINNEVKLNNYVFSGGLNLSVNLVDKVWLNLTPLQISTQTLGFSHKQTPITPEDLKFTLPFENTSGNITDINKQLYSIGAGLEYKWKLARNWHLPISVNYNYTFGSLISQNNSNWNSSYAGISIGIEYGNKTRKTISDTTIVRDTVTIVESSEKISLISTTMESTTKDDEDFTYISYLKKESFQHSITKPTSLLTGEIKAKFIDSNGQEFEEQKLKVSQIVNATYSIKTNFNKKSYKKSDFTEKLDTNLKADIPKLKFSIDYIAEAGLKDWIINVSNGTKNIKQFSGDEEKEKIILWDIAQDIKLSDLMSHNFSFNLTLADQENTTKQVAKGTFAFQFELDKTKKKPLDKKEFRLDPTQFANISEICTYIKDLHSKEKEQLITFYLPANLNAQLTEKIEKQIKKEFVIKQNPSNDLLIVIE